MKNKYHKVDNVQSFYSCVDGCTHLVVTKWPAMEGVDISFVDSNLVGQGYSGIWGRIKRAWLALFGKPIYYAEVIMNEEEFNNFLDKARAFHNSRFGEPPLPLL